VANNQNLLDFVSAGGTLVVQYNTSVADFNGEHLTPYPTELSRARVSVEEASVDILDPGNEIFHFPNEITSSDFDGWVQERGLYFMSKWDEHFKPLLSCHDPGEAARIARSEIRQGNLYLHRLCLLSPVARRGSRRGASLCKSFERRT
jgi:hypothetical protein